MNDYFTFCESIINCYTRENTDTETGHKMYLSFTLLGIKFR